jgi:hypothetical protein
MTHVAIIAAMPGELKPLVRGWRTRTPQRRPLLAQRNSAEGEWIAACAGAGSAATRAFAAIEKAAPSTWSSPSAGPEPCAPKLPRLRPQCGRRHRRAHRRALPLRCRQHDLWLVTSPRSPTKPRSSASPHLRRRPGRHGSRGHCAPGRHARHPVLLHQGRQRRLQRPTA